jgi:glycosyltransferase involved in cell wall biosynthesis
MKIGIDAHVLGKNLGGVERFVAELVKQLPNKTPEHDYVVFVTKAVYAQRKALSTPQVKYVPLAFSNPLIERLILLPYLVKKYQLDALMVQRLAPWFCGKCKLIVAIHDLTPIKFADAYPGLSNKLVRLLTKNTIKRADLILTPTKAITDEIHQYCTSIKSPIAHFYNGVDTSAFTMLDNQANTVSKVKYLLTVGAIERRKNLETIINMMPKLNDQTTKLYIMGGIRDHVYFSELMELVESLDLKSRVQYLGFMTEEKMIVCYQNAAMFITASKDEGFNIPPLESMACGVTVACSSIPVHLELFEGAAIFFKTESVKDLHFKVESALDNRHITDELKANGLQKVKQFTWHHTASNVANAIKAIV